ncbi:MAG TPA: proliferating cell nuclear antigen (pcna) [Candidatus Norongarragalinales archaeon]|nr:proliferating cell nuclear antigen (pcna) [Candidatus Norongarragalinales archaeon]
MEFSFKDARFFKQCIDAVGNLIDEGSFEISKEGIHLRSLDPSQIAMVDFRLPKGHAFASFDVDEPRTISLNLQDLSKVLSRSKGSEKVTIVFDEKEGNRLLIDFAGDSKRDFKLPLLDLRDSSIPKEPKVQLETAVKIKAGHFKEMLKDVVLVSSHLQMEAQDGQFNIEAHGDSGDLKVENNTKTLKDLEVKAASATKAMYPAEYLDKMTRAAIEAEPVHIEFGTNKPIRLSYKISEAEFVFFLAPRVESA